LALISLVLFIFFPAPWKFLFFFPFCGKIN
jgi:hypothetical protein